MTVSDSTDVVVKKYIRQQFPILEEGLQVYLQDELQRIEAAIRSLNEASVHVTDKAPDKPVRGMVRYAVGPWNPLSNGYTGLVVYNGTAWAAV